MIINNNELKFAEKVILIDATYINKVTKDLSQHFSQVIGRELPKADLPIFLECVAMDAAIQPGENVLQVLFVYDKEHAKMDAFNPSDLKKELNDVAYVRFAAVYRKFTDVGTFMNELKKLVDEKM